MGKSIKTRTRYSICGSDFSAQEPRSTASLANDEAMLNAYNLRCKAPLKIGRLYERTVPQDLSETEETFPDEVVLSEQQINFDQEEA